MDKLYVCTNMRFGSGKGSCALRGSKKLLPALKNAISQHQIDIKVEEIICMGQCEEGPAIRLAPGGPFYLGAKEGDIAEITEWIKDVIASEAEE